MQTLDLVILIVLAVGMARGIGTGAIRQVAGLVGLVLAFILSLRLMATAGQALQGFVGLSDDIAPIAGFIAVFLIVEIAVFVAARIVEKVVGTLKLSAVNRLAGGVLGVVKAGLLMSLLFLVLGSMQIPEEDTREASKLYEPVAAFLPVTWEFVSSRLPEVYDLSESFGRAVEAGLVDRE